MVALNDKQQRLLNNVKETLESIQPTLDKLEEDFQYAHFRAKAPVIDAIRAAEVGGVPFKQVVELGFKYPAKLQKWLQPPDAVVRRMLSTDVAVATNEVFEETVAQVRAVTRDSFSGEFKVHYQGNVFTVPSTGQDMAPWSVADNLTPQGVYELIKQEFPAWELLEDDEE